MSDERRRGWNSQDPFSRAIAVLVKPLKLHEHGESVDEGSFFYSEHIFRIIFSIRLNCSSAHLTSLN